MKKILLLFLIVLLVGCTKEDEETERTSNLINNPSPTIEATPSYVDTNPITVGIYKDYKLVHEYNTKFKDHMDIAIFNVLFTNNETVTKNGSFKNTWQSFYDKYTDIGEYKVGFKIEFDVNGEHKENMMLDPSNQYLLDPYLYPYLYDDIHNSGNYSHVTMKDIKGNTVYSSIKLYLHQNTNEITSPITLTVFTYKDDNDFIDGNYRGNSKYTITINNK